MQGFPFEMVVDKSLRPGIVEFRHPATGAMILKYVNAGRREASMADLARGVSRCVRCLDPRLDCDPESCGGPVGDGSGS